MDDSVIFSSDGLLLTATRNGRSVTEWIDPHDHPAFRNRDWTFTAKQPSEAQKNELIAALS